MLLAYDYLSRSKHTISGKYIKSVIYRSWFTENPNSIYFGIFYGENFRAVTSDPQQS